MRALLHSAVLCTMLGCGSGIHGVLPAAAGELSNNWEISVDSASPNQNIITKMSGAIVEYPSDQSDQRITADLIASSPCYSQMEGVAFEGSLMSNALIMRSFGVRGQFIDVAGSFDASHSHLTGTLKVGGGCGDGQSGVVTGERYSFLSGSYNGRSGEAAVSATIQQDQESTGIGTFPLEGTLTLSTPACNVTGELDSEQSFVSGDQVLFAVKRPDGSMAMITGTTEHTASSIIIQNIHEASVDCFNGQNLTLDKQL